MAGAARWRLKLRSFRSFHPKAACSQVPGAGGHERSGNKEVDFFPQQQRSNSQSAVLLLAELLEHRVGRALLRLVEDAPLGKRRCARQKGGGSGPRDTPRAERSGAEE